MTYAIPPMPVMRDPDIQVCEPFMKHKDILGIRKICDEYLKKYGKPGQVGFHEFMRLDRTKRSVNSVWLPFPAEDYKIQPIYDLLAGVVQEANANFWRYRIWGFQNSLHYVQYTAKDKGHFDWHQDKGDDWRLPQRKLSVTMQLSDPKEYEGGGFQILNNHAIDIKPREIGTFYIFPSNVHHRVLPVTKGTRRALVGWLCGDPFQ